MMDDSQGNGIPKLPEGSAFKVLGFALSHFTDIREDRMNLSTRTLN